MNSSSCLHVLVVCAGVAAACTANAGVLVSVNPHAAQLPQGTPPLAALAEIPCVAVNAYHVSSDDEVGRALAYPSYGKPRILSDDARGVDAAKAKRWISRACAAGVHYEHYDGPVGPTAMSGERVGAVADFPADSRDVLAFIRDESCASDLEPGGKLSRKSAELLWNDEPVSLIGHSWMGAVAGRNFAIEDYLDVLAAHRVNLTRIWVVEQWTGLAVDRPGAPVFGNAALVFAGDLADGTVDLGTIDDGYRDRLREFVQAASERGIVVQITLFDRHGLLNDDAGAWGHWRGSPYNRDNNVGERFSPGAAGKAPPDFVDLCRPTRVEELPSTCPVQRLHFTLLQSLQEAVAGAGNVIFEVMNEPLAEEWGENSVVEFHRWVAAVLLGSRGEASGPVCFDGAPFIRAPTP